METDNRKFFLKEGYVHFKGVISPDEITQLRHTTYQYAFTGVTHVSTSDFLKVPCFARLPFQSKVVEAIRSILGSDYATLTQFLIAVNLHNPVWHRDSQSQEGREYLYDPNYMVCKCAVYLQDNDVEWGGGIEIVPRSHLPGYLGYRTPFSRKNPIGKVARRLQRAALRLRDRRLRPLLLPFKSGDALLFHANLIHRAPQPNPVKPRRVCKCVELLDPLGDKLEFRIDWQVSLSDEHVAARLGHQKQSAADGGERFQAYSIVRLSENYLEDASDSLRFDPVFQGYREEKMKGVDSDLGHARRGAC